MHMLGTVLSQILKKAGILMAQWFAVVSQLKKRCNNIIVAGIDRVTLIAQFIKSKLVVLKWSIEHLVARLIIAVRLTKVELMIAILNLGVRGHQALTIVRQIPQRVLSLLKRGR
jgi:hypothetical protein